MVKTAIACLQLSHVVLDPPAQKLQVSGHSPAKRVQAIDRNGGFHALPAVHQWLQKSADAKRALTLSTPVATAANGHIILWQMDTRGAMRKSGA